MNYNPPPPSIRLKDSKEKRKRMKGTKRNPTPEKWKQSRQNPIHCQESKSHRAQNQRRTCHKKQASLRNLMVLVPMYVFISILLTLFKIMISLAPLHEPLCLVGAVCLSQTWTLSVLAIGVAAFKATWLVCSGNCSLRQC